MQKIKIGDRVKHTSNIFGEGVIINILEDYAIVKFETHGIKEMSPTFLEKIEKNNYLETNISEKKSEPIEVEQKQDLEIKPSNLFELSILNLHEKELLKFIRKNTRSGLISFGTSPTGYSEAIELSKIGFVADNKRGLLLFCHITKERLLKLHNQKLLVIFLKLFENAEKEILKRLLESPLLVNKYGDSKKINFPFRFVIVNNEITKKDSISLGLNGYHDNLFFKNFENDADDYNTIFDNIDRNNFSGFTESMTKYILHTIHPEYVTITFEQFKVKEKNQIYNLNYQPFELDEKQLKYINNMNLGHHLFLANPGTGKSVLLLSKAFRVANIDVSNNKVLVTCYNNNLSQKYNDQSIYSGLSRQNNLFIMTFHKLLLSIVDELRIERFKFLNGFGEIDYEKLEKIVKDLIEKDIKIRKFNAIFIDEVQLLSSDQLDLLYSLLETEKNNHYFYMYGDLNQDVSKLKRKGQASWQNMKRIISFNGRVKYLDVNYRNTFQINQYLKDFQLYLNKNLLEIGLKMSEKDSKVDSSSLTYGNLPKIVKIKANNKDTYSKVVDYIIRYKEQYDLNYDDIVIIFPYRQAKLLDYEVLESLKGELINRRISYSLIIDSNEFNRTKLNQAYGVRLSTAESVFGLDFKAVFLVGLKPLEYFKTSKEKFISRSFKIKIGEIKKEELIEYYAKNGRLIYAAASRAKEHLVIFNDLDSNSAMHELITIGGKSNNYEESKL